MLGAIVMVYMQGDPAALVQPVVAEEVLLQGLRVKLGPDLRATYSVVMNFNISGEVELQGPADPLRLQPSGVIKLDAGEVGGKL